MPTLYTGGKLLDQVYVIKTVRVNANDLGQNTLVAGVAGKSIVVLGYLLNNTMAVLVDFNDTAGNILGGPLNLLVSSHPSYSGGSQAPAFWTAVGQGLRLNLSLATAVTGHLAYIEV